MKIRLVNFCVIAAMTALFVSCENNDDYEYFGSISGTVTDRVSEAAISGANVILSPGGTAAQTDANGLYVFDELEPGDYSITVQRAGYRTDNSIVTVKAGKNVTVNFSLVEGGN